MTPAVKPEDDDTFGMLRDVAQEALLNGDRGPADVLLKSLRKEVTRLESPTVTTGRQWEKDFVKKFGGTDFGENSGVVARKSIPPSPRRLEAAKAVKAQVREIAKMIANAPKTLDALPNPEHGQAQAFTTIQYKRARRRHRDPLAYMDLTGRQMRACKEIRRINEAINRMIEGGGSMTGVVRVDGHGPRKDPVLDAMGEDLWAAYIANYRPWTKRNRRKKVKGMSVINIVLYVLRDHISIDVIASNIGTRNRNVAKAFRAGLDDYVD